MERTKTKIPLCKVHNVYKCHVKCEMKNSFSDVDAPTLLPSDQIKAQVEKLLYVSLVCPSEVCGMAGRRITRLVAFAGW